ncbi:FMN-dependent L-lactate dehydrogenase LldD [Rhodospirillum sp. A1_3_36]|uniref:FMN-dependent L-lactate dehydrogenase LldD n=1 Tax=Rhodospirillum sp. A1_3_36 TaxID=3391666 RepID=UPI0039A6C341
MIISSALDYRQAARRRLPPFLFDYIDGGANAEQTLRANVSDLCGVALRQRVLKAVGEIDLSVSLFGETLSMPVMLSPVGLTGMFARRGEVQAARAAQAKGVPFIQSTVSVCSIEEVSAAVAKPIWFQLYVLKDRGFMRNVLERAMAAGVTKLVFTVDMPTPGARYRDAHSGMSGPFGPQRRILQAMVHPRWAWDVGVRGKPHDLGNISHYLGKVTGLADYVGWLANNFDPSIGWSDLEWIRDFWKGDIIIKGILDGEDAKDAARFGAQGLVVSNHGGRQLDGVPSTAQALPAIAEAVGAEMTVLVDGGVRSGLDVIRMLALGAKGVLLGRAPSYALAVDGGEGVETLLDLFAKEMRVAMTLTGVTSVDRIDSSILTRSTGA